MKFLEFMFGILIIWAACEYNMSKDCAKNGYYKTIIGEYITCNAE